MFKPAAAVLCAALLMTACGSGGGDSGSASPAASSAPEKAPSFQNASVHDPSIVKDGDTYYVFGSHLASAKTTDLMKWTQITSSVGNGNKLIPNVKEELKETFTWAKSDTLWAPDVIKLADGKYYMYYDACKGDSPVSALGVAVSDSIEGPYKNLGVFLKSGMWGQAGADGTTYNATKHPNVVDPNVFFDKDGTLWMVYGSYSGGIFILKMDPKTGFPLPDQGYGKKLLGGNHARIEGPYILYSKETNYYYLFLSFGGLDAKGGYNIRVARSKNPDGPYLDPAGKDMIEAKGKAGTTFDDKSIEPFGGKLMGNLNFAYVEGETPGLGTAYVSPGHNSALYDAKLNKYFLIFHTRFPSRGEAHEIRVHQMFMNADGWPVVAPHRYAEETIGKYKAKDIAGEYKLVNHGKDISNVVKESVVVTLEPNGKISGKATGKWKLTGDHNAELTIDGATYKGVFLREWDGGVMKSVMTFTAMSADGVSVWGSHVGK